MATPPIRIGPFEITVQSQHADLQKALDAFAANDKVEAVKKTNRPKTGEIPPILFAALNKCFRLTPISREGERGSATTVRLQEAHKEDGSLKKPDEYLELTVALPNPDDLTAPAKKQDHRLTLLHAAINTDIKKPKAAVKPVAPVVDDSLLVSAEELKAAGYTFAVKHNSRIHNTMIKQILEVTRKIAHDEERIYVEIPRPTRGKKIYQNIDYSLRIYTQDEEQGKAVVLVDIYSGSESQPCAQLKLKAVLTPTAQSTLITETIRAKYAASLNTPAAVPEFQYQDANIQVGYEGKDKHKFLPTLMNELTTPASLIPKGSAITDPKETAAYTLQRHQSKHLVLNITKPEPVPPKQYQCKIYVNRADLAINNRQVFTITIPESLLLKSPEEITKNSGHFTLILNEIKKIAGAKQ